MAVIAIGRAPFVLAAGGDLICDTHVRRKAWLSLFWNRFDLAQINLPKINLELSYKIKEIKK